MSRVCPVIELWASEIKNDVKVYPGDWFDFKNWK